jgi:septum site-determining protein MinC
MRMQDDSVSIKGVGNGLLIALDATEQWLHLTDQLARKLDERQEFFQGARITIDVGERPVQKHDMIGLKALLERRNLNLIMILSDSETTNEAAQALDVRTAASSPEVANDALPVSPEEAGESGVLIRRTLRSGRTVHSHGHVVVIGDVNPGAEIIAAGDVVIWGRLRGNVHAGANGDEEAVVCALNMTPTQLRIASHITTSPPGKHNQIRPEMALLRGDQIIVEAWKQ